MQVQGYSFHWLKMPGTMEFSLKVKSHAFRIEMGKQFLHPEGGDCEILLPRRTMVTQTLRTVNIMGIRGYGINVGKCNFNSFAMVYQL